MKLKEMIVALNKSRSFRLAFLFFPPLFLTFFITNLFSFFLWIPSANVSNPNSYVTEELAEMEANQIFQLLPIDAQWFRYDAYILNLNKIAVTSTTASPNYKEYETVLSVHALSSDYIIQYGETKHIARNSLRSELLVLPGSLNLIVSGDPQIFGPNSYVEFQQGPDTGAVGFFVSISTKSFLICFTILVYAWWSFVSLAHWLKGFILRGAI